MERKEVRTTPRIRGLLRRVMAHFETTEELTTHEIPIIEEPSPADIARAHELIQQYGLEHLLRP